MFLIFMIATKYILQYDKKHNCYTVVEFTLILHEHQSKFELSRDRCMAYVAFFRIYVQFLSNRDYLERHNWSRY